MTMSHEKPVIPVERQELSLQTEDGAARASLYAPAAAGSYPGVLFFMDAVGIRPTLEAMAARLAGCGYLVLMPDLFYRAGPYPPMDGKAASKDEAVRSAMMERLAGLSQTLVGRDLPAYVGALLSHPQCTGALGALGYCMGGTAALTAAGMHPERIKAAASIHGGFLATDRADSPHLLAERMRARVYLAVAQTDPMFTSEEEARLAKALREAGVNFTVEVYSGVMHGFAVPDLLIYDEQAAERHWRRVLALFEEALSSGQQ